MRDAAYDIPEIVFCTHTRVLDSHPRINLTNKLYERPEGTKTKRSTNILLNFRYFTQIYTFISCINLQYYSPDDAPDEE